VTARLIVRLHDRGAVAINDRQLLGLWLSCVEDGDRDRDAGWHRQLLNLITLLVGHAVVRVDVEDDRALAATPAVQSVVHGRGGSRPGHG
jgi:hypothetical protein